MKTRKYLIILLFLAINLFWINKAEVNAETGAENVKTYGYFQYIEIPGTDSINIVGYVGNEEIVVIPSEIEGKQVEIITAFDDYFDDYDYFCSAKENIKEIYIPDGVIEINGFNYCKKLEKVHIANSVQRINATAFQNCIKLKEVILPTALKEIGDSAFAGCSNLKKVIMPYGLEQIGECAFSDCTSLKEIIIPDSVTKIGEEAFFMCKNLVKVKLSNNLKEIKRNTFTCCKIKNIEIPKKVTKIEWGAFTGNSLTKVTIPSKVTYIGTRAFAFCNKLKTITIKGTKLKTIKKNAFQNIHSKAVFDVPNKLKKDYKQLLTKGKNFKSKTQKIK